MKKKVLSLILIFAMLMGTMFILSGCGSNNNGTTNNQEAGENISEEDNMIYPKYDKETKKYGYAKRNGEYVIEPKYESADFFDEEYKIARVTTGKSISCGIINMSGEYILEPKYSSDTKIDNGYIIIADWVKNGNHYSIADTEGNVLYDFGGGDDIRNISKNGLVGNWGDGYYNLKGELIIKANNTDEFNANGYANASLQSNGKNLYGILKEDGTWVVEPFAKSIGHVNKNGYANYETEDGKTGIININGEKKELNYETISSFGDYGLAFAKDSSGKYGIINESGELVVEPKFDSYTGRINDNGVGVVKVDDKYGTINSKGEYIIEPKFKTVVGGYSIGMWTAYVDNDSRSIGKDGKELFKE